MSGSDTGEPRQPVPHLPPGIVNYRKPILKHRNFRRRGGRRGGRNCEAVPYPQPHDNIHLQGLLVDSQVFLYDLVAFRFLRTHRGFFGEFNRHYPTEDRGVRTAFDEDIADQEFAFPPDENVHPVAVLNLMEAYFLALVGNCLEIWDGLTNIVIPVDKLMSVFSGLRDFFPYFFAAYYHFRIRNYVVTTGIKFGTDFVLYEYGPLKTHSIYMAFIVIPGMRDPSMGMIDTLQRVANAAKKDALLVEVAADGVDQGDLAAFDSFTKMQITEIIVRRREKLFDKPLLEDPADYEIQNVPDPYDVGPAWNSASRTPLPSGAGYFGDRGGIPNRRPRRSGFQFPTVFMGIRRVFRGRLWTLPASMRAAVRPPIQYPRGPYSYRARHFVSRNAPNYRPPRFSGRGARHNWRR